MKLSTFFLRIKTDFSHEYSIDIHSDFPAIHKPHKDTHINSSDILFTQSIQTIPINHILDILSYLRFYFVFKNLAPIHHITLRMSKKEFFHLIIPEAFVYESFQYQDNVVLIVFTQVPTPENPRDAVNYFPELFTI